MTTTVTKESLAARIAELESGARSLKEDYTLAAYKMLLATMEAEPVAWEYEWASYITCGGPQDFERIIELEAPPEWAIEKGLARNIIPLYRHAPASQVVPEEIKRNPETGWCVGPDGKNWSALQANSWNARRAAMKEVK